MKIFKHVLLQLAGLLLLIIAVYVNSEGTGIKQILQGHVSTPSITLAIVGGLVFIIAFFGCCGAIRESHCMLITVCIEIISAV